jgi:hypothetical protein
VDSVDVKASATVDSAQIKDALLNVATVVTSYTSKIKDAATESVDTIRVQVVAGLVAQITTVRASVCIPVLFTSH